MLSSLLNPHMQYIEFHLYWNSPFLYQMILQTIEIIFGEPCLPSSLIQFLMKVLSSKLLKNIEEYWAQDRALEKLM